MSKSVLFLVFNRPDTTARVLDTIRRARPARLYVAADGPRSNRAGEAERCDATRKIATTVDWPCEVRTLFRDQNLGCRIAVSTALDWFFTHEEEGIILEDDCVASDSFFPYCAELLDRFRDDERIMCVSGDNYQLGRTVTPYSYYFSRNMNCCGWATWRRAWRLYDRDMALWPEFRDMGGLRAWSDGSELFEEYWQRIFNEAAAGKIDSWGYRFLFSCWAHTGLTCIPVRNLVSNIGFGGDATHTTWSDDAQAELAAEELSFPLRHPPAVYRHTDADKFEQDQHYVWPKGKPSRHYVSMALRFVLPPSSRRLLKRLRAELAR